MVTIFLVIGTSGSRSNEDNSTWYVKAFYKEEKATRYAERLNRRSGRLYKARELYSVKFQDNVSFYGETKYFNEWGEPKPDRLDPERIWAWEIPRYYVQELELC